MSSITSHATSVLLLHAAPSPCRWQPLGQQWCHRRQRCQATPTSATAIPTTRRSRSAREVTSMVTPTICPSGTRSEIRLPANRLQVREKTRRQTRRTRVTANRMARFANVIACTLSASQNHANRPHTNGPACFWAYATDIPAHVWLCVMSTWLCEIKPNTKPTTSTFHMYLNVVLCIQCMSVRGYYPGCSYGLV